MIEFVNAKINIGLQIVRRREDGYHDLQTVFYPVGLYAGLPDNPAEFCDILEVTPKEGETEFCFTGRAIDCPEEKNLVCRSERLYEKEITERYGKDSWSQGFSVILDKHLPDGAGMGGGSADAAFLLRMLNSMASEEIRQTDAQLAEMAVKLGADCPFFIYNRPMYGAGVGEKLEDIALDLSGRWLVAVKPRIYISTREAFAGITPREGNIDLRRLADLDISEWQGLVKNDFEESIFPQYPLLAEIKQRLLEKGAQYASMSGSGSSIYGIFNDKMAAENSVSEFKVKSTIEGAYLLKL